jgi:ferredoxin
MKYKGTNFDIVENETVLDTLLRHQQDISHFCKSGNCHACIMQAISGEVSDQAQQGLKETSVAQQYFLSCQQLTHTIEEVVRKRVQITVLASTAMRIGHTTR